MCDSCGTFRADVLVLLVLVGVRHLGDVRTAVKTYAASQAGTDPGKGRRIEREQAGAGAMLPAIDGDGLVLGVAVLLVVAEGGQFVGGAAGRRQERSAGGRAARPEGALIQ